MTINNIQGRTFAGSIILLALFFSSSSTEAIRSPQVFKDNQIEGIADIVGERINQNCNQRCSGGSRCISSSNCIRPIQRTVQSPGLQCDSSNTICHPPAQCTDRKICKLPIRAPCNDHPSECISGLHCVGPIGRKLCHKPMGINKRCQIDPYWECAEGLSCVANVCKGSERRDCLGTDECSTGLECIGPAQGKQCRKLMKIGASCGTDPYSVCDIHTGLKCEVGICKKEEGQACTAKEECSNGLHCVGPDKSRQCRKEMRAGEKCEHDDYGQCAHGLKCTHNICKIPISGRCDAEYGKELNHHCAEGVQCIGPPGKSACLNAMRLNGGCQTDPYWVCAYGLYCQSNICKGDIAHPCSSSSDCKRDLQCVGPFGTKKCRKEIGLREKCLIDSNNTCKVGLDCVSGFCKSQVDGNCTSNLDCQKEYYCNKEEKCKKKRLAGMQCNGSKDCIDGMHCESNVCRIGHRKSCTGAPNHCMKGLRCVGPNGKELCSMPMSVGGRCKLDPDPHWFCAKGLVCESSICRIAMHGKCNIHVPKERLCVSRSACFGPPGNERCVPPSCTKSYAWCRNGTVCDGISSDCKVPIGGTCTKRTDCVTGAECTGGKCLNLLKLGENCFGQSANGICGVGSLCDIGKCKLKMGSKCTGLEDLCEHGGHCVKGVCTRKPIFSKIGSGCTKGNGMCVNGGTCDSGTCKFLENQSCNNDPDMCMSGTKCLGKKDRKTCKKLVHVGGKCNWNETSKCHGSLVCENKRCKSKEGESCTRSKLCRRGTACVGPSFAKKCKKLMKIGHSCGTDPYWVCQKDLTCEKQKCKYREGQKCIGKAIGLTSLCEEGTACVGPPSKKRCRKEMDVGEKCGNDPYWVCRQNLQCENLICKRIEGQACEAQKQCQSGTLCVGTIKKKICKRGMALGGKCRTDPFWVCEPGLICVRGKCSDPKRLPLGGNCGFASTSCAPGLLCTSVKKHKKRCVKALKLGAKCNSISNWSVCKEGLNCHSGRCCK